VFVAVNGNETVNVAALVIGNDAVDLIDAVSDQ